MVARLRKGRALFFWWGEGGGQVRVRVRPGRVMAMSQSFDQIYFEARSETWRFCSLIIPSNGSIRRC